MRTHWRLIVLLGWILSVIAATAVGADPTSIARYELRLDTEAQGPARVTLTLVLDHRGGETAVIPFPFPDITGLSLVEGPAGTLIASSISNGRASLLLTLPDGAPSRVTLRLNGEAPKVLSEATPAGRTARVTLLNTQPESIRDLRLSITFPEGLRGHAIREARPPAGKADAEPRAVLDNIEGRSGVRLQVDALPQGETAALRVELARADPSPAWFLAGLVLSVLYLISFRDLVRPRVE